MTNGYNPPPGQLPDKVQMAKISMTVLAWLYLVFGGIFGLIYLVMGFVLVIGGTTASEQDAIPAGIAMVCIGLLVLTMLVVMAVITFKAAKAFALEKKKWGRIWGIIVGIFSVFWIVGIFILIALFSDEANNWATN